MLVSLLLTALLALLPTHAPALERLETSLDVTTGGKGALALAPGEVGAGPPEGIGIPSGPRLLLPPGVNLVGFHRLEGGDTLFAVDTAVRLKGGLVALPRDVVRSSPGSTEIEFEGALNGIPDGIAIDAVSLTPAGDLVLSFDVALELAGKLFADEDLVRFEPGGGVSLFFSPTKAGIDPALDLDALHVLSNGDALVSFDGSGTAGDIRFSDEDLLEIDASGSLGVLARVHSGSGGASADLDAAHAIERDLDGDGWPDRNDNCVEVPNPAQLDANAFEDDDLSIAGVQHYGDACDADLNEDGLVGPDDFFAVLRPCLGALAASEPECAEADLDGDGLIGPSDFFGGFRPALGTPPGPGITE